MLQHWHCITLQRSPLTTKIVCATIKRTRTQFEVRAAIFAVCFRIATNSQQVVSDGGDPATGLIQFNQIANRQTLSPKSARTFHTVASVPARTRSSNHFEISNRVPSPPLSVADAAEYQHAHAQYCCFE